MPLHELHFFAQYVNYIISEPLIGRQKSIKNAKEQVLNAGAGIDGLNQIKITEKRFPEGVFGK